MTAEIEQKIIHLERIGREGSVCPQITGPEVRAEGVREDLPHVLPCCRRFDRGCESGNVAVVGQTHASARHAERLQEHAEIGDP